jgi:hypothetical protein
MNINWESRQLTTLKAVPAPSLLPVASRLRRISPVIAVGSSGRTVIPGLPGGDTLILKCGTPRCGPWLSVSPELFLKEE